MDQSPAKEEVEQEVHQEQAVGVPVERGTDIAAEQAADFVAGPTPGKDDGAGPPSEPGAEFHPSSTEATAAAPSAPPTVMGETPQPMDETKEGAGAIGRPQSPASFPHGKKRGRESLAPATSVAQRGTAAKKGKRIDAIRETRSPSRLRNARRSIDSASTADVADASNVAVKGSPPSSPHSHDSSLGEDELLVDDAEPSAGSSIREGSPKRRRHTPPERQPDEKPFEEAPEVKTMRKGVEEMEVLEYADADTREYVIVGAEEAAEISEPDEAATGEEGGSESIIEEPPVVQETNEAAAQVKPAADDPKPKQSEPAFTFAGYTPWKQPTVTEDIFASSPSSSTTANAFKPSQNAAFGAISGFGSRPFARTEAGSSTSTSANVSTPAPGAGFAAYSSSGTGTADAGGGFSSYASEPNGFVAKPSTSSTAFQSTSAAAGPGGKRDGAETTSMFAEPGGDAAAKGQGDQAFVDPLLESGGETGEPRTKGHVAMGGVTDADRMPGFEPQTVPTGEEGWTLLKAVRCKLFEFGQDKNWHESGVGFLRLLREDEDATRYRLVMRTDGVFRLILNQTLGKAFRVEQRERYLNLVFLGSVHLAKFGLQKSSDELKALLDRCIEHIANPNDVDPPEP